MSSRSFRSVGWVAGIAATALGCYMVNLKVASERGALEDVETRIVLAERDIRVLQTEIGTRGRLAQLEKWNVKVLALSAPAASQFMDGSFQLATLVAPKKVIDPAAPVVLASAPAPERRPVLGNDGVPQPSATPAELMHVASLRREVAPAPQQPKLVQPRVAEKLVPGRPRPAAGPVKIAQGVTAAPAKAVKPNPLPARSTGASSAKLAAKPKAPETKLAKAAPAKAPAAKAQAKTTKAKTAQ